MSNSIYWNFEGKEMITLVLNSFFVFFLFPWQAAGIFFSCRIYFTAIAYVCSYKCSVGNPSFELFTFEFKHHHSLLMLAQHTETQRLSGFIFSGCKTNSSNFLFWVKTLERMSLDESTATGRKPLLVDAEGLWTARGTAKPQRRGRIFYLSSQNTFSNWIWSSLGVIIFFSPQKF